MTNEKRETTLRKEGTVSCLNGLTSVWYTCKLLYGDQYWDPSRFGHVGVISLGHVALIQVYLLSFRLFFFPSARLDRDRTKVRTAGFRRQKSRTSVLRTRCVLRRLGEGCNWRDALIKLFLKILQKSLSSNNGTP